MGALTIVLLAVGYIGIGFFGGIAFVALDLSNLLGLAQGDEGIVLLVILLWPTCLLIAILFMITLATVYLGEELKGVIKKHG